jgi:hypothetical protein
MQCTWRDYLPQLEVRLSFWRVTVDRQLFIRWRYNAAFGEILDIEDTIQRASYRDLDLVHLRVGNSKKTRWRISHREAGMKRSYGFAASEELAHRKIDAILSEGREGL